MTAGLRFVVCLQEAGWNQVEIEVVNFLLLFSQKQNSVKGYCIVCKCSVKLWSHDSRAEICVVFTRGGLESSAKNSTSRFPTISIYFLEKDSAKYMTSLLKAG